MLIDAALLGVLSDWCINLSAGWFGAAVIVSPAGPFPIKRDKVVLYGNIVNSVAYLGLALNTKRYMKRAHQEQEHINWIDVNAGANVMGAVVLIVLTLLLIAYLLFGR